MTKRKERFTNVKHLKGFWFTKYGVETYVNVRKHKFRNKSTPKYTFIVVGYADIRLGHFSYRASDLKDATKKFNGSMKELRIKR